MKIDFVKNSKGQSLVELMIALGIMTTAFFGIMALINNSLAVNKTVTDSYISTYLAAEGIELVKDAVENNIVSGKSWRKGLPGSGAAQADVREYETDYTVFPKTATGCDSPSEYFWRWIDPGSNLYFQSSTNAYRYSTSGETGLMETPFQRKITISYRITTSTYDKMVVHSIVSKDGDQLVDLEDHFFNTRQTSSSFCD